MSAAFVAVREPSALLADWPSVPRVQAGLPYVLFRQSGGDVLFTAQGRISSVEDADDALAKERSPRQKVKLSAPTRFTSPVSLNVVAGSLKKVTRFRNPESHFNRSVVAFQDIDDLAVLTEGMLYIERSIFRSYFSSLPWPMQAEFAASIALDAGPDRTPLIDDYGRLASAVLNFVEQEVVELLVQLARLNRADDRLREAGAELPDGLTAATLLDLESQIEFPVGKAALGVARIFPSDRETDIDNLIASTLLLKEARLQLGEISKREEARRWREPIFLNV